MGYSMTQPEGAGHQVTPPFDVEPVPAEGETVHTVAPEYGRLCVDAVNDAMDARTADFERSTSVPNPYGR